MTARKGLSDSEYAEMAADYASNPLTPADIAGPVESTGTVLRMGRPTKTGGRQGKTPSTTIRLPEPLRQQLATQAEAEAVTPAEIVRRAVAEYIERHTA